VSDNQRVLDLAAEIRRVDGNHTLGAAALAEALEPWLDAVVAEVRAEYEADLCNTVNGTDDPTRLSYLKCRLPAGHGGWHMDLGGVFSG
jgi:hypothetical protein